MVLTQHDSWDLGGQPRFRDSWEKYCRDADAIVYVVDASDSGSMDIAKTQLHQLLSWPSLAGIPLLVLGNKNDLSGAFTVEDEKSISMVYQLLDQEGLYLGASSALNVVAAVKVACRLGKGQLA